MADPDIRFVVPTEHASEQARIAELVKEFYYIAGPTAEHIYVHFDQKASCFYCECHVEGRRLVELATTDVPLDPDEQPDYRANREIVANHAAFENMKNDAKGGRSFSNIVVEYTTEYQSEKPLKIIGGQHRFEAIKLASDNGVSVPQGIKVYFGLTQEQKLDVQLTSNTVIAVSTDLFDRMQETVKGPHLRDWCQKVGLLVPGGDFADKRQRGGAITVRDARTFIINYFSGKKIKSDEFDSQRTIPYIAKSGQTDLEWEAIRGGNDIFSDAGLTEAGEHFSRLAESQRRSFSDRNGKPRRGNADFEEKAFNSAVLSSWAFTAGVLSTNRVRLDRHFQLEKAVGKDPLNAVALARGRHKTDPDNYRGLGYRTDAKERGRLVELFYLQAEKGDGINPNLIDLAIKKYHAKQALLEVQEAEERI